MGATRGNVPAKTGKNWYYVAAAATFVAGILHITIVPNVLGYSVNIATFFIITGIAQIFWAIPTLLGWNKIWYYTGMTGTTILVILWVLTRLPGNFISQDALPVTELGVTIEGLQLAYIGLGIYLITNQRKQALRREVRL